MHKNDVMDELIYKLHITWRLENLEISVRVTLLM